MYIYSQVIPFGSIFTGTTYQFPLIWESVTVTFVMIPAGVLCYRDDTGKRWPRSWPRRARMFPTPPVLGMFLVMFVIINIGVLRLRRLVRGDQGESGGHLGGLPVAVSRGESL